MPKLGEMRDNILYIQRLSCAMPAPNTPAFRRWFGASTVRDAAGEPLLVYRGQHGQRTPGTPLQSRLPGYTFCSKEIAEIYAQHPNNRTDVAAEPHVIRAYLRIEKPVFVLDEDPFAEFSHLVDVLGHERAAKIALDLSGHIQGLGLWLDSDEGLGLEFASVADLLARAPERLRELYIDAFLILDKPEYIGWFKEAGFDGAMHMGNGESAFEMEYRIFSPEQALILPEPAPALEPEYRFG